MSIVTSPTVGRKVWYRPCANDLTGPVPMTASLADGTQPLDATIIAVHNDRLVNVLVVDQVGKQFLVLSCTLLQDGDEPSTDKSGNVVGRYVEWMPYQKAQAAKTA